MLTVLIPAWNAGAAIGPAIDSVLEATDVELECIVIDDASTDSTAEEVERRAARDGRVHRIALPVNGGVSAARNVGLDAARGQWLTFLDADDRFRPGGLSRLMAVTRTSDALAVVGQQRWIRGRRAWISAYYDNPDVRQPGRKTLATSPGLLYYASPHAKLFHVSLLQGLRFSGRVLGDQPWVIRALLRAGDRVEVIGDDVYDWLRPGRGDATSSITATTRASARRGLEAAAVATEALRVVGLEADRSIDDPSLRRRFMACYLERLLRSDLGIHVALALGRRDPDIGQLFSAIEQFIAQVPEPWIGATAALAQSIVEPPMRAWAGVVPAARPAFRSLLATAIRVQPALASHGTPPFGPIALGLASRGTRIGLARALLLVQQPAYRLGEVVGRLRRRRSANP